jgi:hypothetical protein
MVTALLACGHTTAYQRCMAAAGFNQDPVARAIQQGNCQQVGNRETVQAESQADREQRERFHAEDRAERERARTLESSTAPPTPVATTAPTPAAPACIASEDAWLIATEDAVRTLNAAARAHVQNEDFKALATKLGVRPVREGTRCRVTGPTSVRPFYPVTLLEGELVGETGWMVLDQAE